MKFLMIFVNIKVLSKYTRKFLGVLCVCVCVCVCETYMMSVPLPFISNINGITLQCASKTVWLKVEK